MPTEPISYVEFSRPMLLRLGQLDARHRIAFAAKCAEEVLPFLEYEPSKTTALAGTLLDLCWAGARGTDVAEQLRTQALQGDGKLHANDQEHSDPNIRIVEPMLSVSNAIRTLVGPTPENAIAAGDAAMDSIENIEYIRKYLNSQPISFSEVSSRAVTVSRTENALGFRDFMTRVILKLEQHRDCVDLRTLLKDISYVSVE